MDTITIDNRNDFALWAIERAKAIVGEQGTALALAAKDGDEEALRQTGNALGSAIAEALLEVFDGLMGDEDGAEATAIRWPAGGLRAYIWVATRRNPRQRSHKVTSDA